MCGIFGVVFGQSALRDKRKAKLIERLFVLSETRGKEAAGVAFANGDSVGIYKSPSTASRMLRSPGYRRLVADNFRRQGEPLTMIGHSRLVTDGERDVNHNNQPVEFGGIVGVHNGIIVNDKALWERHSGLSRRTELDSEIIFALLSEQLDAGSSVESSLAAAFDELAGAASIAALFDNRDVVVLASNNGSLYSMSVAGLFVFASESYILKKLSLEFRELEAGAVEHLGPGRAVVVSTKTMAENRFELGGSGGADEPSANVETRADRRSIRDLSEAPNRVERTKTHAPLDLDRSARSVPIHLPARSSAALRPLRGARNDAIRRFRRRRHLRVLPRVSSHRGPRPRRA